jgi:hypothetical protein
MIAFLEKISEVYIVFLHPCPKKERPFLRTNGIQVSFRRKAVPLRTIIAFDISPVH